MHGTTQPQPQPQPDDEAQTIRIDTDAEKAALNTLLAELAEYYMSGADGEAPGVEISDEGSAAKSQYMVWVDPNTFAEYGVDSQEELLRLAVDSLNHEIEHIRSSQLNAKSEFMDEYPVARQLAGLVLNLLEDRYIDGVRAQRYPGMRKSAARKRELVMGDDESAPPLDTIADDIEMLSAAVHQLTYAGFVKGFAGCSDERRNIVAQLYEPIEAVRYADDPQQRVDHAHEVMAILGQFLPDGKAVEDFKDALDDATDDTADRYEQNFNDDTVDIDFQKPDEADIVEGDELAAAMDALDGAEPESEPESEPDPDAGDESANTGDDEAAEEEGSEDGEADAGSEDIEHSEDVDGDVDEGDEMGGDAADDGSDTDGDESADTGEQDGDGDDAGEATDGDTDADETGSTGDDEQDGDTNASDDGDAGTQIRSEYGLDDDEDLSPRSIDKSRFERFRNDVEKSQTPMAQRKRERDAELKDRTSFYDDIGHRRVEKHLQSSGLADDIERAFNDIESHPRAEPARTGTRLNRQNLVRRVSGDQTVRDIYEDYELDTTGDLTVAVSLDSSGSMKGDTSMRNAKTALAALSKATDATGDEFAATHYFERATGQYVDLVTAPDESFDMKHLNAIAPGGGTPTALAVHETNDLLDRSNTRRQLLIVITDGRANVTPDGEETTEAATEAAAAAVRNVRQEGTPVVGIAIGGGINRQTMEKMFGADGYVMGSSDTLADDLLDAYDRYSGR